MDQDQIVNTIIQTINTIFGNIFSSIDNTIFDNLDNIVFQKFLCRKKLVKYLDRCVKLDPQCFFMFMLEDRQVFAHTNDEFKSYIVSKFGKMNMDQNEMSFNDEDYHTLLKKASTELNNSVYRSNMKERT